MVVASCELWRSTSSKLTDRVLRSGRINSRASAKYLSSPSDWNLKIWKQNNGRLKASTEDRRLLSFHTRSLRQGFVLRRHRSNWSFPGSTTKRFDIDLRSGSVQSRAHAAKGGGGLGWPQHVAVANIWIKILFWFESSAHLTAWESC